jgi:hypothetical protein
MGNRSLDPEEIDSGTKAENTPIRFSDEQLHLIFYL